jgi:hypothetical protein
MLLSGLIGAGVAWYKLHPQGHGLPDSPAVTQQIRDVAKLETLDVTAYKKIVFTPDAPPPSDVLHDAWNWAVNAITPAQGKAIVFANVHFSLDLAKLSEHNVRIKDSRIWIVLPDTVATVELKPADTEVIGSTLDSEQTAQLFETARATFERDVGNNRELKAKAHAAAERAIAALLAKLGFTEVNFVSELPGFIFG